jgi:hypothetical protein
MKKVRNSGRKTSSETITVPSAEVELDSRRSGQFGRRSFLKGLGMAGATLLPASALLATRARAASVDAGGSLGKGDASILRFLCAAEILESDLWEQYWELGGNQAADFASFNPNPAANGKPPTSFGGNGPYMTGLEILDGDMPQYIQDNTDDEFSHANFLLAYLKFKGANTADLDLLVGPHFRTLPGSAATGSANKGRLTNLTKLTIDTSFWGRYRSDKQNPDLNPNFPFTKAVPSLNVGQHTAIPRTDADSANLDLITAIAYTAGFHFAFIEVGGTRLYHSIAQRVSHPEVLRIVLSIGPTETQHFQTWQDKAGNAQPGLPPLTVVDPVNNNSTVTFVDLHASTDEALQANLIMPEPTPFLRDVNPNFPICSIIRPTETEGVAMASANGLAADGLFIGQTQEFFQLVGDLATDADQARREGE